LARTEIPLRVRIGVTGHRTLADPTAVARKLRQILAEKIAVLFAQEGKGKGSACRFVFSVFSSLAEGADRLVAEEILQTADAELIAVLPLAAEEYSRDFAGPGSIAEFKDLLARAGKTIVMETGGQDPRLQDVREKAYEDAGRYVADHCDLLVAVWDGMPARGRGGTAEIVDYARKQGRPLAIIPTDPAAAVRIEKK
jgi:hypothetical protein